MNPKNPAALVRIPGAPAIPGLAFRLFRDESDFPAMVAVIDAISKADELELTVTVEDFAREFRHLENSDPHEDFLFAEVRGDVVGYCMTWWAKAPEGDYLYNHRIFLIPRWRGKGISEAMLRRSELRLRELSKPNPKDSPRFFQSLIEETESDLASTLERAGYAVYRYGLRLVRPDLENVPDLPFPEGIEVRPVKPEHRSAIIDAWNEACKDMRSQVPISDEMFAHWRESPNFDSSMWQIAWHGDEVVGTVMNFVDAEDNERYNRKRGHPEMISVKRGWRRRGIARALLARSLMVLKERGMTEAALGVDAENPSGARHLYEGMGFRVVRRAVFYRKPMD
jgi:ribosomal protein S18 acetylase RimI-like enzyme